MNTSTESFWLDATVSSSPSRLKSPTASLPADGNTGPTFDGAVMRPANQGFAQCADVVAVAGSGHTGLTESGATPAFPASLCSGTASLHPVMLRPTPTMLASQRTIQVYA